MELRSLLREEQGKLGFAGVVDEPRLHLLEATDVRSPNCSPQNPVEPYADTQGVCVCSLV